MESINTPAGVQGIVLMHLLDRAAAWPRAELGEILSDIDPGRIDAALTALAEAGVVTLDGATVAASPCARYMADVLDVVAI